MATNLNKIKNPDFFAGRTEPLGWTRRGSAKGIRWRRSGDGGSTDSGSDGLVIESATSTGGASSSQTVVCKPGAFYRIEACVSCDLDAADESSGFVLAVSPIVDDKCVDVGRETPGVHRASAPVTVRACYQAPDEVRRLRVSVGVRRAAGTVRIHVVRCMQVLEPDEASHDMAVPPPPYTVPAPREALKVCVCSETASERPITRLLKDCLGRENVRACAHAGLRDGSAGTDAVLLPDAVPPNSIRSVTGLLKLAVDRMVVISLPALARLTKGTLSVRRVEQEDDPIYAKVTCANHATRGFALQDTFAFSWSGRAPGSFIQNHFRRSTALKAFLGKHGFATLLHSMCDQEVTSERPVCLYKETTGGGLVVLDMDPIEAKGSTADEPALAMYFLLSILGRAQNSLGQYVVPARKEADFRDQFREMSVRFAEFVVHDADVPIAEVTEQLITIGRNDQTFGLPLTPKPVILIRTGLESGDVESAYGAMIWFKQFVRMAPHRCPYAEALAGQFRMAWVPCLALWESRDGWRRLARPPVHPMDMEVEGAELAALIDVVSVPINRVRVVLPTNDRRFQRYESWLPKLSASFKPGRYFTPGVADENSFSDFDNRTWRHETGRVEVSVDRDSFKDDACRDAIAAGAQAVRIEIPGCDFDFTAHSIQRTDVVATVLEHVIGLQFGLIAVNRGTAGVRFDGFPPVAPGGALIVDRRDPLLRTDASQVG